MTDSLTIKTYWEFLKMTLPAFYGWTFACPALHAMTLQRSLIAAIILACTSMIGLPALGQDYPAKPIRLIIPFAPGGGTDLVGRVMTIKMSSPLGQKFVVENRAGASTTIGSDLVAKASPDGYTLLLCALPHATNPSLLKSLPYDTQRDFSPITLTAKIPSVLVVNVSLAAKSVKELSALSAASAKGLSYSSPGSGTAGHLAMELLKQASGINALHVAYKGAGPQVVAVLSGEVDAAFATISTAKTNVAAGKLRALAMATSSRSQQLPQVPTLAEAGYPGLEAYAWFGLLAPAKTPTSIIQRLNREANVALRLPDVKEMFENDGVEAAPSTPEELAQFISNEIRKWATVIKLAGITPD